MNTLSRKLQGIEETFEQTEEKMKKTELSLETVAQAGDEADR
jgi:hypothetical protein